VVRLIVNCI